MMIALSSTSVAASWSRRRQKFPTNEDQFERWVDYGLLGKGHKKGKGKGHWSLPQMHLFLKLLEQNQHQGIHPIDLCTLPIWSWLYLGDEADMKVEQVERVMRSWQAMQLKHPAKKKTRDGASKTVAHIASDHVEGGKRILIKNMVHIAETLEYPETGEDGDPMDTFFHHLNTVIDPQGKDRHNGPRGVPLSAETLVGFYEANRVALHALSGREPLPRKYWFCARDLLLYGRAQYQQEQPQFASEVTGKPSTELFHQQTMNEIVASACRDLRQVLGIIINHPALCDQLERMQ